MSLKFYEAYMKSIAQDPVKDWREVTQQMINDTWSDTSTVETVKGQKALGLKTYSDESVQLNSLIDPKTGTSFGDNYRKIIYKVLADNLINEDLTLTTRFLGKYYQFEDYTWLTINTNTTIGSCASAVLQKCNNLLKWYDLNGVLHEWPCVFERTLSSTGINYGSQGVPEVGADTVIKVQLNDETASIPFNKRFLFDKHAFQVKQINNHISSSYMEIYVFETQVQADDDLINNIAGADGKIQPTTTKTEITPDINKILAGKTQSFSVYKYIDGIQQADTYNISVTGAILGVNYSFDIVDGNNFTITNLKESTSPLIISCENKNDSEDIVVKNILLGGIW